MDGSVSSNSDWSTWDELLLQRRSSHSNIVQIHNNRIKVYNETRQQLEVDNEKTRHDWPYE